MYTKKNEKKTIKPKIAGYEQMYAVENHFDAQNHEERNWWENTFSPYDRALLRELHVQWHNDRKAQFRS